MFEFFVWSGLVSFVMNLAIGVYVFLRNLQRSVNRLFGLFSVTVGGWSVGSFLVNVIGNEGAALGMLKVNYLFAVWLPSVYFHFICEFLQVGGERKRRIQANYFVSAVLSGIIFTPWFLEGLKVINDGKFRISDPGPLYGIFFLFFSISTFSIIVLLLKSLKISQGDRLTRLQYMLVANVIAIFAGLEYFTRVFGLFDLPPFDDYVLVVYLMVLGYAIVKHRLMDIEAVVQRTIFYSLLMFIVSLVYILSVFVLHAVFFSGEIPGNSYLAGNLAVIVVITLSLKPVESYLRRVLDKKFFKGSIEEIARQKMQLESELERKDRLKSVGILAAGMAHEIKNPLTMLKTFFEYLPAKKGDREFLEKYSRIAGDEVWRVEGIVKGLLDFSKPAAPVKVDFDLTGVMREMIDALAPRMAKAGIEVEFDDAGECWVSADRNQIKQAVLNILLNAIEAMEERGGKNHLKVRIWEEGSRAKIAVRDSGVGISQEKIKHVFNPFFSDKKEGTGLGLAMTHSLIQQNGGKINVQSQTGLGSEFTILL